MQVIDLVHSWRGDVMKFAGDAMIIAFYPDAEEVKLPDGGLRHTCLRCAKCACEVRTPVLIRILWPLSSPAIEQLHTLAATMARMQYR